MARLAAREKNPGTWYTVRSVKVAAITELPTTLSDKVEKTNVSPIHNGLEEGQESRPDNYWNKFSNYRLSKQPTTYHNPSDWPIFPRFISETFDMDQFGKIRRHQWKRLKNLVKLSNLEGIRLKRAKIAPQNCGNLQTFVWRGGGGGASLYAQHKTSVKFLREEGLGGYSLIWSKRVCVAEQGMVFRVLSLKRGT